MRTYFTSEAVTEGHPDKICDQISDAILDELITKEAALEKAGYVGEDGRPAKVSDVRCACETFVTTGTVMVAGEIRCQSYVDVEKLVRKTLRRIGYDRAKYGFDCDTCGVLNLIHGQSPDIAQGVDASRIAQSEASSDPLDQVGAGDQGMMFGYATNETPSFMPTPIHLAQKLAERLAYIRKQKILPYLRPDGKTQVSIAYEDDVPKEISALVISAQHAPSMDSPKKIRQDLLAELVAPVLSDCGLPWNNAEIYVNPTGRFVVGGPMGDTGLTGRKIIVDTYGGMGRHGGGAFSGKDCTKVDRSGAYAARWVAKNVVAAGLAQRCEVQLAYAIGVARPVSIRIDTQGSSQISEEKIAHAVQEVFDLRPAAIIRDLALWRPIFSKTAVYGHFGRSDPDFSWEATNKIQELLASTSRLV